MKRYWGGVARCREVKEEATLGETLGSVSKNRKGQREPRDILHKKKVGGDNCRESSKEKEGTRRNEHDY